MKHQSLSPSTKHIHRTLIAMLFLGFSLYANETATITVSSGEDHKFLGIITAQPYYYSWGGVSENIRDSVIKLIYGPEHLNSRGCRVGGRATQMNGYVKRIKNVNPDIMLLYCGAGFAQQDIPGYVSERVADLRMYRDTFGFTFDAVGAINEPNNNPKRVDNDHIVELITTWRDSLDASSFRNAKLIAPENSNQLNGPEGTGTALVLLGDPAGLSALGGIGYHSHSFPLTKQFADQMRPYTKAPYYKEVWQTEAGGQDWFKGVGESHPFYNAVTLAGNCLAEINLITNYWGGVNDCWYMADSMYQRYLVGESNGKDMGIINIRVVPETETIVLTLKYIYQREISKTFPPGTGMRMCTSNLVYWKTGEDTQDKRFEYMYNTQGARPQLNAACGQDTSGRWGLAVTNQTGLTIRADTLWWNDSSFWQYRWFHPDTLDYDVTLHVEELENYNDMEFAVKRCNVTDTVKLENNATMRNGNVTVTVKPGELVTLKSVEPLPTGTGGKGIADCRLTIDDCGIRTQVSGRSTRIAFTVPSQYEKTPVSLVVYDTRGRLIQTIANDIFDAGEHVINWDRNALDNTIFAHGVKVIRLSTNGITLGESLLVDK